MAFPVVIHQEVVLLNELECSGNDANDSKEKNFDFHPKALVALFCYRGYFQSGTLPPTSFNDNLIKI